MFATRKPPPTVLTTAQLYETIANVAEALGALRMALIGQGFSPETAEALVLIHARGGAS